MTLQGMTWSSVRRKRSENEHEDSEEEQQHPQCLGEAGGGEVGLASLNGIGNVPRLLFMDNFFPSENEEMVQEEKKKQKEKERNLWSWSH